MVAPSDATLTFCSLARTVRGPVGPEMHICTPERGRAIISFMLSFLRTHGPVLLGLTALVFAAFGRLLNTPLWDPLDAQIVCDAHTLSLSPASMFNHLGFYFSQPLLQLAFLGEYHLFGLNIGGYLATNLAVHSVNSFLVYMLVNMLFPRRSMAVLAAVLFALAVGSYGRVFMTIHQLESLLLALLHLLVLYFFIRNDFRRDGRVMSPLFLVGLVLFLLTGLTKAASFSLIGCLMAYKAFFYQHRASRAILSPDILVFLAVSVAFYVGQHTWGYQTPTIFENAAEKSSFSLLSIKNIFRYLNLMFFPMQQSPMLDTAPLWVVWMYQGRVVIRVLLTLSIISYSFFGFVFGSRAIRFFIAWTYITLLPFTSHTLAGQWLNLSHLYLTSLGFCVVLAAGANGTSGLLRRHRRRRFLPYLVPAVFAVLSLAVTWRIDAKNKSLARHIDAVELRQDMVRTCQQRPARIMDIRR